MLPFSALHLQRVKRNQQALRSDALSAKNNVKRRPCGSASTCLFFLITAAQKPLASRQWAKEATGLQEAAERPLWGANTPSVFKKAPSTSSKEIRWADTAEFRSYIRSESERLKGRQEKHAHTAWGSQTVGWYSLIILILTRQVVALSDGSVCVEPILMLLFSCHVVHTDVFSTSPGRRKKKRHQKRLKTSSRK